MACRYSLRLALGRSLEDDKGQREIAPHASLTTCGVATLLLLLLLQGPFARLCTEYVHTYR